MPAHRKTHCVRGHDTRIVGRDTGGTCKACRTVYSRRYGGKRIADVRAYKIARGCQRCGYRRSARALCFHHPDPSVKQVEIGRSVFISATRLWAEIEKCQVLCMNCHAETHEEMEP